MPTHPHGDELAELADPWLAAGAGWLQGTCRETCSSSSISSSSSN